MIKVKTNPMKYKDSNGNMIDVGGVIGKEVTDLTLTKSNVPADSKTVGDKLNKLSQEKVDHDELNEAILNVQTQDLQFVESVAEMTDSKRNYVLKETGEIWSYMQTTVDDTDRNLFNTDEVKLNQNPDGTTRNGAFSTGLIPVDISYADPYIVKASGSWVKEYTENRPVLYKLALHDADGTCLVQTYFLTDGTISGCRGTLTDNTFEWNVGYYTDDKKFAYYDSIKYVSFLFYSSLSSVTETDVPTDIVITTPEPKVITTYAFAPTGRYYGYVPTEIVQSVDEMVNTDRMYVLEETGTYWVCRKKTGALFTNQIPLSIDEEGNIYNDIGYKDNYRYNSSYAEAAYDNTFITGYMPVKIGDVMYFSEEVISGTDGALNTYFIGEDFSYIASFTPYAFANDTPSMYAPYEYDSENQILYSITVPNREGIAYVKVTGIGSGKDAVITVNEEIVYGESAEWVNTGIKYADGASAEDLARVSEDVAELQEETANIESRVSELEKQSEDAEDSTTDDVIPDYWKVAVDAKRDTILAQLDEGGHESFGFTWGADIHGKNGYTNPSNGAGTSVTKNIGHVCQYATEVYDLPFAMFSGDIMSQGSHSKEETVHTEHEDMMEIFSPINFYKLLIEKGNHDGAYGAPVDGVYYLYNIGGKELYNNLFRKQALDRTRVFGGDGSYFYVDTPNNMRVIMLNGHTTGDDSVDENGYAVYNSMKYGVYGNEQLEWLANEALNTNKRIIVSAHQPLTQSMDGSILAGILNAYNNRTSYKGSKDVTAEYWGSGVSDNTYTMISIEKDFASAKGKVIAYFHGHIHKDTIDNTTNTFIVASITTAGADVRDANPVKRVAGTATETALDIVIITDKKIYFNRLGAGVSREVAIK